MLDSYYLLNEKVKKHIRYFPLIAILIFIILLLLLNKIRIPLYLEGIAEIEDNNENIKISIPLNKLEIIKKNHEILLNKKQYNYQIKEIEYSQKDKVTVYLSIRFLEKDSPIMKYKIDIKQIGLLDYLINK